MKHNKSGNPASPFTRFLAVTLTLIMLAGMVPTGIFAADEVAASDTEAPEIASCPEKPVEPEEPEEDESLIPSWSDITDWFTGKDYPFCKGDPKWPDCGSWPKWPDCTDWPKDKQDTEWPDCPGVDIFGKLNVKYYYYGDVPAGVSRPSSVTVERGKSVTLPSPTVPEGYKFIGWFYKYVKFAPGDSFKPVVSSWVIGIWCKCGTPAEKTYNVTYEFTGNIPKSAVLPTDTTNYKAGAEVTVATVASVDGYTFEGWTLDGKAVGTTFTMPKKSVTVKGNWKKNPEPTYNVTYQFTGDKPTSVETPTDTTNYKAGADVTVATVSPVEGYTFEGWTLDGKAVGTTFKMPADNVTVKGSWKLRKFTVEYQYTNVVTGAPAVSEPVTSYKFGETVTVAAAPTLDGYTFKGWDTDDANIKDGKFIMPANNVTLWGTWTPIPVVEKDWRIHHYVVLDGENICVADDTGKAKTGTVIAVGDYAKKYVIYDGTVYVFDRVSTEKLTITSDGKNEASVFYKKAAGKYFKVIYSTPLGKPDGAPNVPDTISYPAGFTVTVEDKLSYEGWTFVGWKNVSLVKITGGTFTMPYRNVLFTGAWVKDCEPPVADEFTVTYEYLNAPDNAPALPAPAKYKAGTENIDVADAPTLTGYTFSGWRTLNVTVTDGKFTMPGKDVKFVGTWKQDSEPPVTDEFTVTYSYTGNVPANAPTLPTPTVYKTGDPVTVKPAPTLDGYTFSGWSTADVTVSNDKFTMPGKNVTFTGSWTIDDDPPVTEEFSVSYAYTTPYPATAPTPPATAKYKAGAENIDVATAPTLDGFTFSGWSTADVTVSNGKFTMPGKNVTFTGTWTENDPPVAVKKTVTYTYIGTIPTGAPKLPVKAEYEVGKTGIAVAALPKLNGYTFFGWYSYEVTVANGKFTMPNKDVSFTGWWVKNDTPPITDEKTVTYSYTGAVPANAPALPAAAKYKVGAVNISVAAAPTLTGYTFSGWSTTDATVKDGKFTMPNKDVKFTGTWTKTATAKLVITKTLVGYYTLPSDFAIVVKGDDKSVTNLTLNNLNTGTGGNASPYVWVLDVVPGVTYTAEETNYSVLGFTHVATIATSAAPYTITTTSNIRGSLKVVDGINTIRFINTYTPMVVGLTVTKIWNDNNNAAKLRPTTVTVDVYADNYLYKTVTLSAATNWTATVPMTISPAKWTVKEKNVPAGYTDTYYSPIKNDIRITNTFTGTTLVPGTPVTPTLNKYDHFAYIVGYEDGTVRPTGNITRAEAATIFFRLMSDETRAYFWDTECGFTDVSSTAWYNNAISTLENAGVLRAYSDGGFHPDQFITRAEFIEIATHFKDEFGDTSRKAARFKDVEGHWAKVYIELAAQLGWINGYEDGTFKPDQVITRAETMTLVNRILDRAVNASGLHADMVVWPDIKADDWFYEDVLEATNSHTYFRTDVKVPDYGFTYECWLSILAPRDWTALETVWATAGSN